MYGVFTESNGQADLDVTALITESGLCEADGQTTIVLDIKESNGSSISQETRPLEIPIVGEPNVEIFLDLISISQETRPLEIPIVGEPNVEIFLDLIFPKGPPIFFLNGKKLQLLSPIDKDEDNLSHILFQLACTVKSTHKKKTYPVILTPIGTTVFQNVLATDKDSGANGLVEYSIVPGSQFDPDYANSGRLNTADGYGFFAINLPHQGQVTVNRTLDYEKTQRYYVTIVATDKAKNESERLSATTTLTINIKDDDDQNPSFIYKGCMLLDGACINPEYSTSVSSGVLHGVLNISPEKIQAVDMDTINSPIYYTFVSGVPDSYKEYFRIDPDTGAVHQVKAVDTSTTKLFNIIIKAQEISEAKRSTTAKLAITVKPVDANPPEIVVSSTEGFVNENSPVGTNVLDSGGNPLIVTVEDKDFGPDDPKPAYTFELTTPFFAIDKVGHLIVNENNLDRDPPNPGKFRFQIVAREKTGTAAMQARQFH
ncbi:Cadherin domain [Popillia japonica]|uniref:Cadherin domain n=1 Tax=Popillia japonica TaxID=7064 RepID=A0AAW1LS01_POPJA